MSKNSTARQARDAAIAFAATHACELAAEIIEWQDTALLRDGRLRELARICLPLGENDSLNIAEGIAKRAALDLAAATAAQAAPIAEDIKVQAREALDCMTVRQQMSDGRNPRDALTAFISLAHAGSVQQAAATAAQQAGESGVQRVTGMIDAYAQRWHERGSIARRREIVDALRDLAGVAGPAAGATGASHV